VAAGETAVRAERASAEGEVVKITLTVRSEYMLRRTAPAVAHSGEREDAVAAVVREGLEAPVAAAAKLYSVWPTRTTSRSLRTSAEAAQAAVVRPANRASPVSVVMAAAVTGQPVATSQPVGVARMERSVETSLANPRLYEFGGPAAG